MSREQQVFENAIEFADHGERREYLESACRDDPDLRKRVEQLLAFHDSDQPLLFEPKLRSDPKHENLIGQSIGRYVLEEEIGEGGYGIVYRAEQTEPVRRSVAIKVIKPGMDTRQVIVRFESERQTLAMLEHPHIARVLDGGATDRGHPYFVMEFVDGTPITVYCDRHQLDVRERLRLFLQVCDAVQHAHLRGIIHRDLKPSNILVSREGEKHVPHVIDFGVAKAIGPELESGESITRHDQVVGTPPYMSPEQASRSNPGIDIRSDIYSLGVLLYELLTGQTPLDKEQLRSKGWGETLRTIVEEEPLPPSSRITQNYSDGKAVAMRLSSNAARLAKQLRGELDWIVIRALEKNPEKRFASVREFALDVTRYLHDEPVHSGKPSKIYRVGRFLRRNRIATVVGIALLAAIVFGVVATQQRYDAIAKRKEAQTVLDLLRVMMETDPIGGRGPDLTIVNMLDHAAENLPKDLADNANIAAEIHSILASGYERINMRNTAHEHRKIELQLKKKHFGSYHFKVAELLRQMAHSRVLEGYFAEAKSYAETSVRLHNVIEEGSPESLAARKTLLLALTRNGNLEEAEQLGRLLLEDLSEKEAILDQTTVQLDLGWCLCRQKKFEEGIKHAHAGVEARERHPDATPVGVAWARLHFGDCLQMAGRHEEAVQSYKKALVLREVYGPMSMQDPTPRIASAYAQTYDFAQAARYLEAAYDVDQIKRWTTVQVLSELCLAKLNVGNCTSAEALCRDVIERTNEPALTAFHDIALLYLSVSTNRSDVQECRRVSEKLVESTATVEDHNPFSASIRAWAILNSGDPREDELAEAVGLVESIEEEPFVPGGYMSGWVKHVKALAYYATDREEAFQVHREALQAMPKQQPFMVAEIERSLTRQLLHRGRPADLRESRRILQEGLEWRSGLKPMSDSVFLVDSRIRLAQYLLDFGTTDSDKQMARSLICNPENDVILSGRSGNDFFCVDWQAAFDRLQKKDEIVPCR